MLAVMTVLMLAAGALHAQLDVLPRVINFDTTLCGTMKCRPLVFKNNTAAPITITSADAFFTPFALNPGPFNFPQTLAPGDSLLFNVCYSPNTAARADTFKGYVRFDAAGVDSFLFVGRTTGPAMALSAAQTNYGSVQLFNVGCLTVRITNTGDGLMVLGPVTGVNPPFTITTPPPATLSPGSSADVTICFTPVAVGSASTTPSFSFTSCGAPQAQTTTLTGTGVLPPRVTLGPVLQITPDPVDFDTALCGTTKCGSITLRNTGSEALTMTQMDALLSPFIVHPSTPVTLPLTLQPNESRTIQVCYVPPTAPRIDSQRVAYIADNRVSLSIAMVFDTSGSMTTPTGAGATRIQAANAGGKVFLDNLVNDPGRGVVDTAAIIRFSSAVVVAQDFTTNATVLANAVPASASGSTRLYDGLNTAITRLNGHNRPGRRVIVVLTDGDDDLDVSDPGQRQQRIDAIVAAAVNNVRIFTIGLGNTLSPNGINTLQQLATRTNGTAYVTSNPDTLLRIYQRIAQELSHDIPGTFLVRGRGVAPRLVLNPASVDFDSVKVGLNRCRTITLSNTGDAPLVLATLPTAALGFTIEGSTPIAIAPGASATVNACFAPARLRLHDTAASFDYNSCRQPERLVLHGVGYDSVVIRITGDLTARPGTTIEYPITLENPVPAVYDVREMSVTLRYNKTLLAPAPTGTPIRTAGAIGQPWNIFSLATSYEANDTSVASSVSMMGNAISSAAPGVLGYARLLALMGNSIQTPVAIAGARMADGNPKVGIISNASFRIDSLCYIQQSLIDGHVRYNMPLKIAAGTGGGRVVIGFTVTDDAVTRVDLFDAFGRLVVAGADVPRTPGRHEVTIDATGLADGLYLARVVAGGIADATVIIINR